MKLRLTRSQADQKGFFGGHKGVNFILNYKLDVSDEERRLIEHYKVGGAEVHEYAWYAGSEKIVSSIRVQDLINGSSLSLGSFGEIVGAQAAIVEGAQNLKGLIAQMRKFGGEEIIEI